MVKRKPKIFDDINIDKEPMDDNDRITRLPNDVIHYMYSFMDSRCIVQSSALSRRWINKWRSHPYLNFETLPFTNKKFPKFMHRFLTNRKNDAEIVTIDFRSTSIRLSLLKEVISYAMSHITQKINIEYSSPIPTRRGGFDLSLFKSHFLQDLCLNIDFELFKTPNLTWDLPVLTTLHLERVSFLLYPTDNKSLDLFSTFSNLKNLVLVNCQLWKVNTFYITSNKLENLRLKFLHHSCQFVISTPKLSSFTYDRMDHLSLLLTSDLNSLETVVFRTIYDNRSMGEQQKNVELLIDIFHQMCNTKFLTLNTATLKFLSRFPELLESKISPFVRLQTLTLNEMPPSSVDLADIISYFRSCVPDRLFFVEYYPELWSILDMKSIEKIIIGFA
ncbi:F-box/LRR-repeat protein 25 [Lactuca sativa]|nr:F-box/LRR-repeat protein 25 [Lactuca sativa]XP_023750445.1 F-box/LRR-repeat protein 25 [Lactuca sativa]XP_023750450.1 F-box/LRR-repeat protein 25 [Lactuca sativa]XP_023750459.1 F-box/LRR-repeat protein 25 [Lactuca sativa]